MCIIIIVTKDQNIKSHSNYSQNISLFRPPPKAKVNSILKEKWHDLSDEEKATWKGWEEWDLSRFKRDTVIFNKAQSKKKKEATNNESEIPKKRKDTDGKRDNAISEKPRDSFQIPKKKRIIK